MLRRLRERAGSESGFTLIELLVVMLILGILAAIAIPAFLNQKNKATDSSAKAQARTAQTAMETCATDRGGSYDDCDLAAIQAIEPTIQNVAEPTNSATTFTVVATGGSGRTFSITRNANGTTQRLCSVPTGVDRGGCPPNGSW